MWDTVVVSSVFVVSPTASLSSDIVPWVLTSIAIISLRKRESWFLYTNCILPFMSMSLFVCVLRATCIKGRRSQKLKVACHQFLVFGCLEE